MKKATSPDAWFDGLGLWSDEARQLRGILLSAGLDETLKWGAPGYIYKDKNVAGIAAFKSYFGLWFYHGARFADPNGRLTNAQEGRTQMMRQWRMATAKDIRSGEIRAFVKQAKTLIESGAKLTPEKRVPGKLVLPDELAGTLKKHPELKKAFDALTPGRQRAHADYIAEAKREETRAKRLGVCVPLIKAGKVPYG
jgi:uncharacterized protein YdeI (YjbR/CyaY-like superfamily)